MKYTVTLIDVAQESLVKQLSDPSNLFTATINVPSQVVAERIANSFKSRGGAIGSTLISGKTGFIVEIGKAYAVGAPGEWWHITVSPDMNLDSNSRA